MDVVFVTVTWRQDLDRFRLLRRSLREVGAAEQFHHVVAVHTEDAELAADLRREPNLDLVLSRDLLGRRIERRRAAQHFPRASRRHWVRRGPIPGWYAQQLTKFAALKLVADAQAVVYWDSDLVALQPIERGDFIGASGRTKFFVDGDLRGDGSDEWNRVSARLLGVDEALVADRQFIHAPTVFDVQVATEMLDRLGDWGTRLLAANAFEYPTYGAWVMGNALDRVEPTNPLPTVNFVEYDDMWDFRERVGRVLDERTAKILGVQSRLHIPPASYERVVERAWR